ncbi:MAG: hypothetical protein ACREP7_09910 [Lysobacter sp.]
MTPADKIGFGFDPEIEQAVLSYLHGHPSAADTLDGIAQWWLPRQRYEIAQFRIEAVLQQLTRRGVLQLRRLPDGSVLYALSARPPASND